MPALRTTRRSGRGIREDVCGGARENYSLCIRPGGSIGLHRHETSDDINYVLSGVGAAICDVAPKECKKNAARMGGIF